MRAARRISLQALAPREEDCALVSGQGVEGFNERRTDLHRHGGEAIEHPVALPLPMPEDPVPPPSPDARSESCPAAIPTARVAGQFCPRNAPLLACRRDWREVSGIRN